MIRTRSLVVAVGALCLAAAGCDLVTKALAKKAMVATLLSTPEVRITAAMIADQAGFDGGVTIGDAGFVINAGDAGYSVPPQTIAFAFLGERVGDTFDVTPKAVTGAAVTLEPAAGGSYALKELGAGTYQLTSVQEPALTYTGGATYDVKAIIAGEAFIGSIENAPPQEQVALFHPPSGFVEQRANQPFTFTRPAPPASQEKRNLGFVTVVPISTSGQGTPTYSNVPQDVSGFLKLASGLDAEWRTADITIPGTAFPEPNKNYLILLQSAKLGGTKGTNLFIGSAIIAGTADVAIVRSRAP
jgi:hypothetical protein